MKNFLKQVLATIVGLIIFGAIAGVMGVVSIIGMIASGEATQKVSDNSVMVLNLSGVIEEQGQENISPATPSTTLDLTTYCLPSRRRRTTTT